MLQWQGKAHLDDGDTETRPPAQARLHMGMRGRGNGYMERSGNTGAGGPFGTGCGIWAHLGPSNHAFVTAHGKDGSHRRQPDIADLAVRRLGDDKKHKLTLGRSPAVFLGPTLRWPCQKTAGSKPTTPPPETCLLPVTNNGTKFGKALDVARDKTFLAEAVVDLKAKFYADSNKGPQARKEADVLELLATLTDGKQAFPLTPQLVLEFGATLQAAGYRSGEQYLGVLKLAHVERDHQVTPALKRAFDLTKRALARDKAKANRAPEFQAGDFPFEAVTHDLVPNELAFPMLTYCLALAFMLRRCELEQLRWGDLTWNDTQVTLLLRKSKTDQAAKGVRRTLGCTCRSAPATCPVELVKELAAATDKAFPGARGDHSWVACSTEGNQVVKEKLVAAWSRAAGQTLRGHSPRRSGTMFYVRGGLSIAEVTYLGRWHSNLVFQYGEEAWEGRPMNKGCPQMAASPGVESGEPMLHIPKKDTRHEKAVAQPHPTESSVKTVFIEDLQTEKPKWVRTSGRSKVIHLLGGDTGQSSATWKTKCGWPFARTCHFTLFVSPPPGIPKCRSCRMNVDRSRGKPDGEEMRVKPKEAAELELRNAVEKTAFP